MSCPTPAAPTAPLRRAPGRPRTHRRLRHPAVRARLHQLALRFRKFLQRLPCCAARRANTYPGHFGGVTLNWRDADLKERRLDAALNTRSALLRPRSGCRHLLPSRRFAPTTVPTRAATAASVRSSTLESTDRILHDRANIVRPITRAASAPGTITAPPPSPPVPALREAAGVEVPNAGFVVLCLATYLAALVPLNWLVFRTLGRVEWAWIAAPAHRHHRHVGHRPTGPPRHRLRPLTNRNRHPRTAARSSARTTSRDTRRSTRRCPRPTTLNFRNLTTLIAPFPAD